MLTKNAFCFKVKAIYVAKGRSLAAATAYESRTAISDESTGKEYKYRAKEDLVFADIILPAGSPAWMSEHQSLVNGMLAAEKRKDAMTGMGFILSIPREIPKSEWQKFAAGFVREEMTSQGFAAMVAGHNPKASDNGEQPHFHVICSMRAVDPSSPTGFAAAKSTYMHRTNKILEGRKRFAEYTNRVLAEKGSVVRVSHLSLKKQKALEIERSQDMTLSAHEREIARARSILLNRPPEKACGYKIKENLNRERGRKPRPVDRQTLDNRKAVKEFERAINRAAFLGQGKPAPIAGVPPEEKSILDSEYNMSGLIRTFTKGVKSGARIAEGVETIMSEVVGSTPAPEAKKRPLPKLRSFRGIPGLRGLEEEEGRKRRKRMTSSEKTAQKYAIQTRKENAAKSETRQSDKTSARNPTKGQT
jgi:hypothetical protein